MKRIGRAIAFIAVLLGLVVGVLFLAVPANKSAEDGPADPILGTRRAVLGFLRAVGIVDPPPVFGGCPYLPTAGGTETGKEGPDGEYVVLHKMEIRREPVYRGVLWPVGDRISYRTTHCDDERSRRRALRLCCLEDGRKVVVGVGTVESGDLDPAVKFGAVRGFVPRSATAYWVEETDEKGAVHSLNAWGDVSGFWRD